MTLVETTPFEDLILGSQFLPSLATIASKDGEFEAQVGVLQCRRCASSFIQVKEALSHYRLHVFETHKEHFTVVVGGACPLPECPHASEKTPIIHFHCTYCSFASTEIMDLPLHMEKRHLAFYREVSLVLRGDDIQRTKEYTCGECGKKLQGTVSTVQHLLAHDQDGAKMDASKSTNLVNGGEHKEGKESLHNGISKTEINNINRSVIQGTLKGLQNGTDKRAAEGGGGDKLSFIVDGKLFKVHQMPENAQVPILNVVSSGGQQNVKTDASVVNPVGQQSMIASLAGQNVITSSGSVITNTGGQNVITSGGSVITSAGGQKVIASSGGVITNAGQNVITNVGQKLMASVIANAGGQNVITSGGGVLTNAGGQNLMAGGGSVITNAGGHQNMLVSAGGPQNITSVGLPTLVTTAEGHQGVLVNVGGTPSLIASPALGQQGVMLSTGFGQNVMLINPLVNQNEVGVSNASAPVPPSTKTDTNTVENGNGLENGNAEERLPPHGLSEEAVEINPLDLLATVLEEDQKSEYPVFPAEHFLLSLPNTSHFLDSEGGGQDDSADGYQDSQEIEEEAGSNDDSDIPSDILLDHPGVFQCNMCNEAFKYQYLLVSHKRQVHQGQNAQFQCQVCNMEFSGLQELKRHMMTHIGASLYTCNLCNQGFSDKPSLRAHVATHGGSAERSNKCETCAIEFVSKSELTRHIVKYQGTCNPNKSTEGVRCATCGEDLANLEALKEHRRTAHPSPDLSAGSGKKGFECDYCGKSFSCRSNLRDHLVVHTGEKPYPCDICGKSFSFIHNMKTHRLTHNEGRNEVCPYCDKAYKSKISLYYHMKKGNCRGLSTKEVPEGYHRCTDCLQMFASEERFRFHKEKGVCQISHRCQHCGLRCSSEKRLKNHLQKGLCTKKESPSTPSSTVPKKRRSAEKEEKIHEEIVCDRCNYTKDCCCTFSCTHCGKRVFSIMAYTLHSEKTCPILKQRRERIRMAIMEKRRRKEGLSVESKEVPEVPENPCEFQGRYKRRSSLQDSAFKMREMTVDLGIEKLNKRKETKKESVSEVVAPAIDADDDSNSGSLTDLSTFTSPNILPTVADATDE